MSPHGTPPGWYPDPHRRHELRYWDGAAWSAHVSDRGAVATEHATASPFGPGGTPTRTAPHPVQAPPWQHAGAPGAPVPPPPGLTHAPWATPPARAAGVPMLATQGQRFGAYLLDSLLCLVTLVIGWVVWSLVTYSQGQTPGKQLMGLRVVKLQTGIAADWGTMFMRQVVIQVGIGLLSAFLFGIPTLVAVLMIFSGTLNQTGWDRMAGTVVVVDPDGNTLR